MKPSKFQRPQPATLSRLWAACVATSTLLASCGGSDSSSPSDPAPASPPPPAVAPAPAPALPAPAPAPAPAPVPPTAPTPSLPLPGNHAGQVAINGEARVGRTLTALVTDADGVFEASVIYQWLADAQPIPDANSQSYPLPSKHVGQRISVRVSYTDHRGHHENIVSAATDAVAPHNLPGSVSIQGIAKVGQTLSAQVADADGLPASIAYQWLLDGQPIAGATASRYQITYGDAGKVIAVHVRYTDGSGYPEAITSVPTSLVLHDGQPTVGGYHVHQHPEYGKYVDAREFGADPTGKTDSIGAIRKALAAAHEQKAALYLHGHLRISEQIRIDASNAQVTAIFGEGREKTKVIFNKPQVSTHNPQTNETDSRDFAGLLVDGQNGKIIGDLALEYTGEFYRPGESYFGRVNGIYINDASHTTVQRVWVKGANRAGIYLSSTKALAKDPSSPQGRTYKARLIRGEIAEKDVPAGNNNRVIDSHLHENRVAGILVAYQRNFTAERNHLARNGHAKDGGTGYGIATMAGSYNFGVAFRHNTTDHNYRKGLDVHDGNRIVIEHNTVVGDRLYGIAVYNRGFSMTQVRIANNTIQLDPDFRLPVDDDLVPDDKKTKYHGVAGIHLATNTQRRDLRSASPGKFEILNNKIDGLDIFRDAGHTYGIEFRNYEPQIDYTLDILQNDIRGKSSAYLIAIFNETGTLASGATAQPGAGSGTIRVHGNTANMGVVRIGMPVIVQETGAGSKPRGSISLTQNHFVMQTHSNDGWSEGFELGSNAPRQVIEGNTLRISKGHIGNPVLIIRPPAPHKPVVQITRNAFFTESAPLFMRTQRWLETYNARVSSQGNKHNGENMPDFRVN
ncbi:MAG: right-handed parallel beta-helix repeat-containing protein [Comamonadaceae bacterium]|nr:right-handed parallel beta-helix repeat-containing protein [Comamonadaceae bacterium]